MKASVITLHSVYNYGTQLQALATQLLLSQYFDDVEFIDFKRSDTYGSGLVKIYSKGNPIKWLVIKPTIRKWQKVFGAFQKKYLNISKNEYFDDVDFEKMPIKCDALISGSDQVWNTGWNKGIIEPFYLNIHADAIRFSFSSSFGKKRLSNNEAKEIKKRLARFKLITVREESGKEIIEKQLGLKAERILDPTLLLDGDTWRSISPRKKIKGDYILIYCLNRNKQLDRYCKEFSKRTGLKLYRFCTRYDQIIRNGKSLLIPDVLDFVSLIDNAKYVITDSFHASAFSINLKTTPIVFYPEKYSSRLSDFLALTKMENCHPRNYSDFSMMGKKIDFHESEIILKEERKKAQNILRKISEICKNEKR